MTDVVKNVKVALQARQTSLNVIHESATGLIERGSHIIYAPKSYGVRNVKVGDFAVIDSVTYEVVFVQDCGTHFEFDVKLEKT
jgi:hypothetical protein